jgi:pimeloyl-ACP methyl ester carboxylesterase
MIEDIPKRLRMECKLDHLSIHYQAFGEGKPVLLLHGAPLDHRVLVGCMEPIFENRDGWLRPQFFARLLEHSAFSFDVDALSEPFVKPTLILAGKQDHVSGYREQRSILENYPRATFVVLDRAGHRLQIEQEALFNALVDEWLDRVEESMGR